MAMSALLVALTALIALPAAPDAGPAPTAPTEHIRVLAAADLQPVLPRLIAAFAARSGGVAGGIGVARGRIVVEPIFGSTGKLATQISSGLDADVFLAADDSFVDRLVAAGRVDPATRSPYARGRVALWVPRPMVDAGVTGTTAIAPATTPGAAARPTEVLLDPRVTRLVIANPVHAPYGRAAIAILADAGLIRRTRPGQWSEMTGGIERFFDIAPLAAGKQGFAFIIGENAAAAAQMALSSGSVGLIPLSLALTDAMQRGGRHAAIAASAHPPLDQTAIALTGRASPAVLAFLAFLTSQDAQAILQRAGFDPPRP